MIKRNIANIITITRIIGSIIMAPLETLSMPFYIVFGYCGFSDVLDGYVARKLKISSEQGAVLDSISDLLFYSIMMLKVMPYLNTLIPSYMWIMIYAVIFLRLLCYIWVHIKENRFEARHTMYNKLTGLLMFFLPFMLNWQYFIYFAHIVLIVAYIAVIDEIIFIQKNK